MQLAASLVPVLNCDHNYPRYHFHLALGSDMAESPTTSTAEAQKCNLCNCDQRFAWPRVPLQEFKSFIFEPESLLDAIRSGCHACAFLKEGIDRFRALDHVTRPNTTGSESDVSDLTIGKERHYVAYRDIDERWTVALNWLKEDKSGRILEFITADESLRFVSAVDSNSLVSLSWAKDLQLTCKTNHQSCTRGSLHLDAQKGTTTTSSSGRLELPLPTRVLDLGPFNSAVKLWVTPPAQLGDYVCLSHCWGDHQPLRTLSHNIELFCENIPWYLFPKTFQDAIVFARSLELLETDKNFNTSKFSLDYNISLQGPGYVEEGELFCLNIGNDETWIYFLILRCIDEENQVYERIGLVWLCTRHQDALECHPDWDVFGPEQGTQGLLFEQETPRDRETYLVIEDRFGEQEVTGMWFIDSLIRVESMDWYSEGQRKQLGIRSGIAKLTTEQVTEAENLPNVLLYKKTIVPLHDPKDAKWVLTPQNEERKARGERYWKYYLDKVVTIV